MYIKNGENEIHSSGHANQDELKLMIRLFKPKYFAPYHGEYRMLKTHCDLATLCDLPKENTFILANGDVLNITKDKIVKILLIIDIPPRILANVMCPHLYILAYTIAGSGAGLNYYHFFFQLSISNI